ncbi:MAG: VacJ family lipoprotein [Holosporales bacterium]|jgi:phospholipid-binding lipoprotein MlaA|nr:VacJ family lipoprotein [Holosporales bacterium]
MSRVSRAPLTQLFHHIVHFDKGQACSFSRCLLFLLGLLLSGCSTHRGELDESSHICDQSADVRPTANISVEKPVTSAIQPEALSQNKEEDTNEGSDSQEEDEDDAELEGLISPTVDFAAADPFEKMNRALYGAHRFIDLLFVRPIALTYSKVLPKPARHGFANFVSALTAPLRVVCHLLQGNVEAAGKSAGKFVTNIVFGFGGLVNVAEKFGLKETPTGFTETLKKWGARPGPYLVVPGVGPTTIRGAVGFLFDSFLDPVFLFTLNKDLPGNSRHELMYADTGVQVGGMIIQRSQIDTIYDSLEKNPTNRYSKLRALVLQQSVNK